MTRKYVQFMPFGMYSMSAIASGEKTQAIVSVSQYDWILKIRRGMTVRAGLKPWHPQVSEVDPVLVKVDSTCFHDHIAEITTCENIHDPAAMNPSKPTWAEVLEAASVPHLRPAKRERLMSRGWVVVRFGRDDTVMVSQSR